MSVNYYHSGLRIDTSHVDPCVEANARGLLRIIFVTEELQLINAAFMYSLKGSQHEFSVRLIQR